MKPVIKWLASDRMWYCKGRGCTGYGATPERAYMFWKWQLGTMG